MFDKDNKNIELLFERVMTGGPGGSGSDRHRLPAFASDITQSKQMNLSVDSKGLGTKLITMFLTFGLGDDVNEFIYQIGKAGELDNVTNFLHFIHNTPGKFTKESRDASKQLLDRIKPGWDVSTNEDDEIRSFDEIQDEIRNHPGRKALDDHKERMQQKGPVKINIKAGEEYLKNQLKKSGQ